MIEEKGVKYFEYFGDRLRVLLPIYTQNPNLDSSPYIKNYRIDNKIIQVDCESFMKNNPKKMIKINETYYMIVWVEPELISMGCMQ